MHGFNVTKISGTEQSPVDVVFMHGLTGKREKTWSGKLQVASKEGDVRTTQEDVCWPKRLPPDKARVWLAGYPAPLFEALHRGKIEQAFEEEGEDALRELERQGLGTKPLIVVAHSLGGLLVKAILVASHWKKLDKRSQPNRSIADATAAVFFLATPHAGSDRVRVRHMMRLLIKLAVAALVLVAGYLLRPLLTGLDSTPILTIGSYEITVYELLFRWLPAVSAVGLVYLLRPSRHLALLDPGSNELRTLRDRFRKFVKERSANSPVKVSAYYEKFPTWPLGILVSWSSADPGLSDVAPEGVDANHVEICKPAALERLGLLERLKETIDFALAGTEHLALEEPLRIAQRATEADSEDWQLLKLVIEKRNFDAIPVDEDGGRHPRREAEEQLREWVRKQGPESAFHPETWQLRLARTSTWSVDRFIWQVVTEFEIETALRSLRENAEGEFQKWPPKQSKWPGLIPFYRPLRTLEAARTGERRDEPVRGQRIEGAALDKLVADAYERLETAHDQNDRRADVDGATRWLLLRMACLGRATAAVLSFVGYPDQPRGAEPESARLERKGKRQQFDAALKLFEQELRKPLQQP